MARAGRARELSTRPAAAAPRASARADRARWLEAAIRVPLAAADHLGTLLVEEGSHGVVTGVHELAHGARRRTHETVRGFFPADAPERARLAVRAALARADDPTLARARVRWRALDARLWEMDWREHFQPVLAGRSLAVVPPWRRGAFPGRRRVVIHPGMAFGTGQHATTSCCLAAIERAAAPPPPAALDVGTGTGVLAIALAKLGVRHVLAIDTDPQAIVAARANVRRNAVRGRVRLSTRPLAEWARRGAASARRFPLAVANLHLDTLVELEPTLARLVAPGGTLVTSGIMRAQQGRLRAAYPRARWRVRGTARQDSWVTTTFERRDDACASTSRRGPAPTRRSAAGAARGSA